MRMRMDRRWFLIGTAAVILAIQIYHPSAWTTIWPPLLFALASAVLYRRELQQYDWGRLRRMPFWEATFFAVTQGIIAQAIGIVILQYGFGISQPPLPFELGFGVVFSAVVISAILEELVYRKALFGFLERRIRFWPAAAVSSVLFAAAH